MLYFHIGAPKTGSNALQRFIRTHEASLAKVGLIYPDMGREGRHKHDSLKAEFQGTFGQGGAAFAALRELHAAQPDAKLFVSEESFYFLEQHDVDKLAGGLLGTGPVTILGWVREYAGHAVSTYNQRAKAGRHLDDFDTFFEDYMTWPTQAEVFSRWGKAFGWKNVRLRCFSPETLVEGDVVTDCLAELGIDRHALVLNEADKDKANVSPGWESVEMTRAVCLEMEARAAARGTQQRRKTNSALRAAVRKAADAAAPERSRIEYLTAEQRARCNAATRADIAALNKQLPPPGLPVPALRDGPARACLPSMAQVPGQMMVVAMATLGLELGGGLPDVKRERKKTRLTKVAGPKSERRAARLAKGPDAPQRSKPPGNRRKADKASQPAKAGKPDKASKPVKTDKAGRPGKADKAGKPAKANKLAKQAAKRKPEAAPLAAVDDLDD